MVVRAGIGGVMNDARSDDIAPQLQELLSFYREAGADAVLDDITTDWRGRRDGPGTAALARLRSGKGGSANFVEADGQSASSAETDRTAQAKPNRHSAAPPQVPLPAVAPAQQGADDTPGRRFPLIPPDDAEADARRLAATATDLDALRQLLEEFEGCALKTTAKSLCFYRGAQHARLMIIGEAPGRDEDRAGKPFVGRAGQLLDKMLDAIGHGESDVHITNIVYWRPPGNRTPTLQEAAICRPFLERQISLVAPDIVLTLGGPAANAIIGGEQGILRSRGRWQKRELGGRLRNVMPTLHPAYLLRTPVQKRLAWRDLLAVRAALEANAIKN